MNQAQKHEILDYIEKYSGLFNDMMREVTKRLATNQTPDFEPYLKKDYKHSDVNAGVKMDPQKFIQQQMAFLEKQRQLWQNASKAFMGEEFEPVIEEAKGDKRFSDGDWQGNPGFNYLKQAYLLNAEYMHQLVDALEFEDRKMADQVRFYTRQFINSMSPTNYVLTNPEVCREILSSQGENLAKGIDNFVRDLERSPNEAFKITQVKSDAFELGKDLARTPGAVIFQNELIQLIQYKATTKEVHEVPLLIVPPFINKYYILDLDEKKSMVRWLVEQGFTVFIISWVNPDEKLGHLEFDAYVNQGVLTALDVVSEITGAKEANIAGYCIGGTTLAMTQAYLAKTKRRGPRIKSMTLLTTLLDFAEPGEVETYISNHILPVVEQSVANKSYFDGRILGLSFSLLRENNLFWSFFIEHYLKGKDPIPFDILYWNSDSTNVPGQAFLAYLQQMYIENRLIEPESVSVNDEPIKLSDIQVPCYCLAAQADHIVLWQSAYDSALHLPKDTRFVLTESGHVAGVINPADKGKYPHWVNDKLAGSAHEWLAGAEQVSGSWWNDWREWLLVRSGEQVKARKLGNKKYPELEPAPGSYVKRRLDEV